MLGIQCWTGLAARHSETPRHPCSGSKDSTPRDKVVFRSGIPDHDPATLFRPKQRETASIPPCFAAFPCPSEILLPADAYGGVALGIGLAISVDIAEDIDLDREFGAAPFQ